MDWLSAPGWLTEILKQFPIVALCGVVLWRAAKYLDAKHRAEIHALQSQHAAQLQAITALTANHIKDLKAQHRAHVKSKQAEIARLVRSLDDEREERNKLRQLRPDKETGSGAADTEGSGDA
jgi:hypothetical protein